MSLEKGRGIVLSRKLSGEADYLCSIFTKNSGRDFFIFKGLKKSKKRPPSASETGTVLDFQFYSREGVPLKTISQFDIVSTPVEIKKSARKIFALYYILEIADKTTGCGDADEGIYTLLAAALSGLGKAEEVINFTLFFIIQYLKIQGILPQFSECSSCGDSGFSSYSLSSRNLKILCPCCCSNDDQILHRKSLDFLKLSTKEKYSSINQSDFPDEYTTALLNVLTNFIELYFSVTVKSRDMLLYPPSGSDCGKPSPAGLFV